MEKQKSGQASTSIDVKSLEYATLRFAGSENNG
jgi:hypothetical protein